MVATWIWAYILLAPVVSGTRMKKWGGFHPETRWKRGGICCFWVEQRWKVKFHSKLTIF